MPDLGPQFKNFKFIAHSPGPSRQTTVVAYYRRTPVGSLTINPPERSRANAEEQIRINRQVDPHYSMFVDEGDVVIEGQLPGLRQWAGGAFERDSPARVSWVRMDMSAVPRAAGTRALSRMMAIGLSHHTARHGEMPRADYSLSDDGAAISRGMRRKYGMKAHPANPRMEATFVFDDEDDDESASTAPRWGAASRSADMADVYTINDPHHADALRHYTADQADAVHRQVDEQYNLKKIGPDPDKDPEARAAWEAERNRRPGRGQMSLF